MKSRFSAGLLLLMAGLPVLVGCSTLSSRIDRNRAVYESYPLEVREKIAAGDVDVGFTAEQVRIALGEPDRVSTRTSPDGTSEVWSYRAKRPRFSVGVGVGVGGGGGSTRVGSGVGVSTGTGGYDDERLRVIFEQGEVSAVERTD